MVVIAPGPEPLNRETPLSALDRGVVTATEDFYVRSHFPTPSVDAERWRLRVTGFVSKPLAIGMSELLSMPARSMTVTLECAGNGRSLMTPAVAGEQWGVGAVGTARWTGVLLADVLRQAQLDPAAQEVVLRGADRPALDGAPQEPKRFERSLTIAELDSAPVLLTYAMNGQPLPAEHGYPLRAVVPGQYAVSSVKWLTDVEAVAMPFRGLFQSERYVYQWDRDGRRFTEPVGHIRVRSLITHPSQGQSVRAGRVAIRGLAWSGMAPIAGVDVSVDGGAWQPARTMGRARREHWRRWEMTAILDRPGTTWIAARATDRAGNVQPEQAEWNRLGYGNNCIQRVSVTARNGTAR